MSGPDANGWLPIETAPRDGREILAYEDGLTRVCRPFMFPRPVAPGEDMNVSKPGDRWEIFRIDYPSDEIPEMKHGHTWSMYPTHWQPLPKPPVQP